MSWMDLVSDEKKNSLFLNSFIFPASHDSGAIKINTSINIYPKTNINYKLIQWSKYIPFVKMIVKNNFITQSNSIYDQLKLGVRVLDLRVTYIELDHCFYIFHSIACIPLDQVLLECLQFIVDYPDEIILLFFKPDWPSRFTMYTSTIENTFLKIIKTIFGDLLIQTKDQIQTKSYTDLIRTNTRVFVYYENRNTVYSHYGIYSPQTFSMNNSWINTNHLDVLRQKTIEISSSEKNTDIKSISCVLTPQRHWTILFNSIYSKSKKIDKILPDLLEFSNSDNGAINYNCVYIDFVNKINIGLVIDLNF